jgi:hypothetical protein
MARRLGLRRAARAGVLHPERFCVLDDGHGGGKRRVVILVHQGRLHGRASLCDELVRCLVHFVNAFIADRKLVVTTRAREHSLHRIALFEADRTTAGVVWSNRSQLDTMSKIQLLAGLVQLPTSLISLLCQLLDPRLELLQHRRRLFRRRGLRQFGSLVVVAGRRLVSASARVRMRAVQKRARSKTPTR